MMQKGLLHNFRDYDPVVFIGIWNCTFHSADEVPEEFYTVYSTRLSCYFSWG